MNPLIGFGFMFFTVVLWNVNSILIFKRLEKEHNAKYKEMGEPGLFTNNNFKTMKNYFKFLFRCEWKNLDDHKLTKMCYLMPILFIAFAFGMFTLQTSISYSAH